MYGDPMDRYYFDHAWLLKPLFVNILTLSVSNLRSDSAYLYAETNVNMSTLGLVIIKHKTPYKFTT